MPEPLTISAGPPSHPSMDFALLREEGLRYLQQLAGEVWTDHNTHDPGITILEALCYAITDLGYRTEFPIEDLLASNVPSHLAPKPFYTAEEILPCHPQTALDYRKLLIDQPQIRDAWVEPYEFQGKSRTLFGLYRAFIEFEDDQLNGDVQFLNHRTLAKGIGEMTIRGEEPPLDDPEDHFIISNDRDLEIRFPSWNEVKDESWIQRVAEVDEEKLSVSHVEVLDVVQPDPDVERLSVAILIKLAGGIKIDLRPGVRITSDIEPGEDLISAVRDRLSQPDLPPLVLDFIKRIRVARQTLQAAQQKLHQHRNLCEDIFSLEVLTHEELGLDASIILAAEANENAVLAELYRQVDEFLSPPVRFQSLADLLDDGVPVEAIFDGPLSDRGLLKAEDLAGSIRAKNAKRRVYKSDIVALLMKIPGVKAVQIDELKRHFDSTVETTKPEIVDLEYLDFNPADRSRPRLSRMPNRTKLVFARGAIEFRIDVFPKDAAQLDRIQPLKLRRPPVRDRLPIPDGEARELSRYDSIQHEFPAVYGLAVNESEQDTDAGVLAKRRQLKTYLLLCEQFLANHLAQLGHVGEMLAVRSARDRNRFVQLPADIPGLESLIDRDKFASLVSSQAETPAATAGREASLLDHLLARLGRGNDSAHVLTDLGNPAAAVRLKRHYLENYDTLSRDRGRAVDLSGASPLADWRNRSGLEQHLDALVLSRQDAAQTFHDGQWMRFRLRWRDDGRELVSTEAYTTYHAAYQVMRDALQAARNRKSYSVESHGAEYRVRLKGGFAFVADSHPFSTRADAEAAIRDYEEWAEQFFHDTSVCVVEHLMLARPYSAPLPELLGAAPTPDPLSFQFSVVYRKSGPIFGDEQNRQAVWRLIAEEAPAHLAWSIHELEDDWDWLRFAKAYDGWRHVMQDAAAPDKQLIGAREHLLRELTKMRLAGLVA